MEAYINTFLIFYKLHFFIYEITSFKNQSLRNILINNILFLYYLFTYDFNDLLAHSSLIFVFIEWAAVSLFYAEQKTTVRAVLKKLIITVECYFYNADIWMIEACLVLRAIFEIFVVSFDLYCGVNVWDSRRLILCIF
jgi:hypothetical protein